MAKNYGYTFSFFSKNLNKRVRRKTKVYRTKSEAARGVKNYTSFFGKGRNPRVVKATKDEYETYVSQYSSGRF